MKKHLLKSIFISLILATGVSNAWAYTAHFSLMGDPVGNWNNDRDFMINTGTGKTDEWYIYAYVATNQYFALNNGGSQYGPSSNGQAIKNGIGGGQGNYNSNSWKFTGTSGIIKICCAESDNREWYPYVWVEESAPTIKFKHPWNGSSWSEQTATKQNDGTYTYDGKYGNNKGFNAGPSGKYKYNASKTTVEGSPATGDMCRFIWNPAGYVQGGAEDKASGTFKIVKLCSLTYNGNGNTGGEVPATTNNQLYNTSIKLSSNTLTKDGYTHTGWNTKADGTGDHYDKGASYTLTAVSATLYAEWVENTYTVTISAGNGGTVSPSGSQTIGQVTKTTVTATANDNYEFANWTATGGVVVANTSSSSTTITATAVGTLTANFRSIATNSLTVVAGANIESVTGSTDPVTLGNTYAITATPKTGYLFSTWTADPAGNATFGSTTTTNTTVTVKNGSVTVTASATENMSTLTTSNNYDAGDPGYEVPTALVNSIGYETTAKITATEAGNGYTFTGWTLTNCTRTDGGADNATSITVRSNGDGKAATVVANYAEDLATTKWYISGNGNGSGNDLTPGSPFTGWATNGIQMFKKSGHSTEEIYYCTITANTVASSNDHFPFKVYNASTSKYWGNNGYWVTKENNHPTLSSSSGDNMKFRPYLVGTYEFKLDATNASSPVLTVTWPVYNQLRISAANPADPTNTGEFDMTGSDNYTVTRSLQANTKYTFKIVYDSEWYGASSGNFTRASATKTLSTSSNDLTITTDIAGDYTFTFNSSDKKLTVAYPALPKHQVTVTVNPAESGTIEGTGDYEQGSEATLVATPAAGYKFVNWTKGEEVVSTTATYTVSVTEPVELVANFERVHDVTITYKCNGVEMQSITQSIGESTPSTITAPNIDSYTFISWEEGDGIAIKEENKEKISIVTKSEGNYVLTANYERVARYLTGNDAGFGMEGEDQWKPNNIKMTWDEASKKYTHTVSGLAAKKYYKFRITDGEWNENKWGYTNLKPTVANTFAAEDNNISFVLAADGDLTITFDGTYIELTTTSSFAAPVYTIVGDAAVTGCHWDVNSVENQMVQDATDKNQFTLVKTVIAVAGEYEYKAIRNHSYDWEVASGTKLEIEKDGTGTITYTLDVSTKKLTAVVSDWVEGSVAQEVTLVGIGEDKEFTEAADHKTTSVAVELEANSVYTFEVVVNSVYMKNNGTMWRGNCTNWTFKSEENNAHIVTDLAGTYTFTWTYEGNKLSVTYPNGTNVPAPVFLGGEMNGWSWIDTRLIPSEDGKTASATVNLTEAKTYEFKIKQGDTHFGNNGTMTRQYHENWIFREKDGENDEKNAKITADIVGDYIFTWTYEGSKLTVTYPEVATTPTIIDEGTNTLTDGVTTDVQVNRAFAAGKLYTISLPFALDAEQVKEIFGTGTIIYEFAKVTKESEVVKLYFQTVSAIAAATPYLIKPTQDVAAGFIVENAVINTTPNNISFTAGATTITMKPILSAATDAKTNGSTEYWLAENTWLYNNVNTIQSLRALFEITTVSGMPPRCRVALGENDETGIEDIITTNAPTKVIENGQLIIIRDGEKFNTIGQKL